MNAAVNGFTDYIVADMSLAVALAVAFALAFAVAFALCLCLCLCLCHSERSEEPAVSRSCLLHPRHNLRHLDRSITPLSL